MTRLLTDLIPPMNFILIKDFVYDLLVAERDNQNAIAAAPPYNKSAEEIEHKIDFAIYKDTFTILDAETLPAVLVNCGDLTYPEAGSYGQIGKYREFIELKIGCFALGCATTSDETEPKYAADQTANIRLNYLVSQASGILGASINWRKQAGNLIESSSLQTNQLRTSQPGRNEAEVIEGREIIFQLRTTEIFEGAPTVPLKQMVGTLQEKDGVVAPFFKYYFNQ